MLLRDSFSVSLPFAAPFVDSYFRAALSLMSLSSFSRPALLQEKNIALKVLLKQREEDKNELEKNILSNIKSLIQPYITKLKRNNAKSEDIAYLNLIESNLEDIISPFSQKLSLNYMRFSEKEIQIANLIKDGKKDKEIMEIMNIAFDTVKSHRRNIRKKLGISGKGISLRNKLLSM
jgi:DNA-binding CsgD family transcriptional regulator